MLNIRVSAVSSVFASAARILKLKNIVEEIEEKERIPWPKRKKKKKKYGDIIICLSNSHSTSFFANWTPTTFWHSVSDPKVWDSIGSRQG